MTEADTLSTPYASGPSPNELTPTHVAELANSSSRHDWLYSEEENIYSYRKNILIRMEQNAGDHWTIYFGHQPACVAMISADSENFIKASPNSNPIQALKDLNSSSAMLTAKYPL